MKTNYCKYLICGCLMLLGIGCSEEHDPVEEEKSRREVFFRIEQAEDLLTRATSSVFEIGDSIGIYAVKRVDPAQIATPGISGNQAHNAKWVKTEEGWVPATLADKVVYPQDGAKLDFYAYYPYDRKANDPEKYLFAVRTNQADEKGMKASDFLVTRNTEGLNEGVVNLTFSHAMSMVKLIVRAESGKIPENALRVEMAEIKPSALYDFGSDFLTVQGETAIITLNREGQGEGDSFIYNAYVPAQAIASGTALFRMFLNEKVYVYTSEAIELTRGNRRVFELTIKDKR